MLAQPSGIELAYTPQTWGLYVLPEACNGEQCTGPGVVEHNARGTISRVRCNCISPYNASVERLNIGIYGRAACGSWWASGLMELWPPQL